MSISSSRFLFLPILMILASTAAADPKGGQRGRGVDEDHVHGRRNEAHSLAEAVRRVERATGGRILSAERVPFDGRDMNRIKVLDASGRVRVITEELRGRGPTRSDDD